MFKQLINLWRSGRAISQLYEEFVEMLEMDWVMFETVMEVLSARADVDQVQDDILRQDIAVNRQERAIRKQIVAHMSLSGGGNIPESLVLMSVVKDAERLGDYCKNLVEVAQMLKKPVEELRYCREIVEIGSHVTQIFKGSIKAFSTEDGDLAREIIQDESLMNQRCDLLVAAIARSDLDANEAVCMALWIRHLKRIEAHLSNICSSVVLPVHRLDYRLEYKKRTDEELGKDLDGDPFGSDSR